MNILRIIASVDPQDGGTVEALMSSSLALKKLGHNVEVVTLDAPDSDFLGSHPLRVHALGRVTERYAYTPKLAKWIAAHAANYDVAIVEGLWNHASVGGWKALQKAGLPYVVFSHGMMDPWFRTQKPLKHILKQIFWWLVQGRVLHGANAVVFTCEEERLLARGVFLGPGYREAVVPLGIADVPNHNDLQESAFRAQVPKLSRSYLLFMGRIHPKKGCDLLIKAFSGFAEAYPELDLVIAGPDPVKIRASLETLTTKLGIVDRVHWPGMLSGDAKWGAFHGAEAFVLPSHQENFGIVIAEAMACGKAVLITDKVNIWREVQASGGGFVEADTLEGVRKLLARWLSLSSAERLATGKAARDGFVSGFQTETAALELLRLLQSFVWRESGE